MLDSDTPSEENCCSFQSLSCENHSHRVADPTYVGLLYLQLIPSVLLCPNPGALSCPLPSAFFYKWHMPELDPGNAAELPAEGELIACPEIAS